MPAHRSIRDFDWLMVVLVCAICALGVLQIFSATRDTRFAEAWWKQAVWILGGFIALAYAERWPADLNGLCLLAPYLGNRMMTAEIARAGGIRSWNPGTIADDDEDDAGDGG